MHPDNLLEVQHLVSFYILIVSLAQFANFLIELLAERPRLQVRAELNSFLALAQPKKNDAAVYQRLELRIILAQVADLISRLELAQVVLGQCLHVPLVHFIQ